MIHNEETTLLQQQAHLERNTQRALCSTVSNEVADGWRRGNSCTGDRQCAAVELMLSPTSRAPQNFRFVDV